MDMSWYLIGRSRVVGSIGSDPGATDIKVDLYMFPQESE